ncbi:NADP-dependent oxidoreductase [Microterricola viridarii]|uniref:Zinc-binding dehydrogenase n=1 Tax=Microterricola viridarii TaxID=412690 RepID=A0A0X8E3E8_9MICO|nr:NADP-dependent oxidoreductase [Microterricola viridarii]AMB58979.1 zinc-binding dehydrogenase [Microterricola viridarii]
MSRAVMFRSFGAASDVLEVVEVPEPHAGAGQVRVRVKAAGLNPVDWKIALYPQVATAYRITELPSGNGNDFSGVIDEVGEGVGSWKVGDEVYGGRRCYAQADYVLADAAILVPKPAGLSWEQAGALDIVGRTAWAEVASQNLTAADTVLVTAAAGGVGVLAVQLAKRAGATVIGTASPENHDYLRSLGVIPVAYGDGLVERIRAVAPQGVTVVLDNHGAASIQAGLDLGVDPSRINTIADRPFAAQHGVATVGGGAASREELAALGLLIAAGAVEFPIEARYPLEQVREAYALLQAGHLRGKIVLVTE